jgi:3-oxoadipate enol-lactonase
MRIKAGAIQVNYELTGKDDGPVVVLSHSLGSSMVMWDPQVDALGAHFRVLCYDTRGHGGSEGPEGPYTLDLLGQDAIALLDALGIGRVHWVGLSMGGMIGQCLALDFADRLQSLILCDTAAALADDAQPLWQERIDTARAKGMQALVESVLERWFSPSFRGRNRQMVARIQRQFLDTPVEGYVGCGEAIRRLNYLDQLSAITIPTLIMVGEDDPATPVEASQAMHERIPKSKLVIVPSARHFSNVEQPQFFNAALLEFLLERGAGRVNTKT